MEDYEHTQKIFELQNARAALFEQCQSLQVEAEELRHANGFLEDRISELEVDNFDLVSKIDILQDVVETVTAELERRQNIQRMFRETGNETGSKNN